MSNGPDIMFVMSSLCSVKHIIASDKIGRNGGEFIKSNLTKKSFSYALLLIYCKKSTKLDNLKIFQTVLYMHFNITRNSSHFVALFLGPAGSPRGLRPPKVAFGNTEHV